MKTINLNDLAKLTYMAFHEEHKNLIDEMIGCLHGENRFCSPTYSIEEEWVKSYKEQFGKEPTFF